MTLRHIIWDMGGTLIDTYPSVAATLAEELARETGGRVTVNLHDLMQRMRASSIAETIVGLAAESGVDQSKLEAAYRHLKQSWETGATPPVMPGAESLIARVRAAGGKNIVVTHRDRESAEALLNGTGLVIDGMITSSDGFARKPNPAMFEAALKRFGLDASETLAIGDRPIDVQAANAAACQALLLRHPGDPELNPLISARVIDRLHDAFDYFSPDDQLAN